MGEDLANRIVDQLMLINAGIQGMERTTKKTERHTRATAENQ
jgi:hypothetical protein